MPMRCPYRCSMKAEFFFSPHSSESLVEIGARLSTLETKFFDFSRIGWLAIPCKGKRLRYGTGSGSDLAPLISYRSLGLTRSLPLPVPYRFPDYSEAYPT